MVFWSNSCERCTHTRLCWAIGVVNMSLWCLPLRQQFTGGGFTSNNQGLESWKLCKRKGGQHRRWQGDCGDSLRTQLLQKICPSPSNVRITEVKGRSR